ncbi:MAG TPA: SDR family NAD(P)-dependent oxidoreductase [Edaphocola sp.]|nr:SDR family NAD(P)-dependent oxidoreductase [Edaphocola sp.]
MNLNQKIAVVTGASSGLGKAIATALIKKNTIVFGISRRAESLQQLQEALGNNFHPVVLDIAKKESVENWVKTTFKNDYCPDILVNNAGIGGFGKIDEMPEEEWLAMVQTNINGMYFITRYLVPFLKQNINTSHIINIGSILGTMGREDASAYCTTKYGVNGFSEALFKELRFDDIKVTVINSGSIATDFFVNSGIPANVNMIHSEDLAATVVHVLETPDNMLINELTVRPLNPKGKK